MQIFISYSRKDTYDFAIDLADNINKIPGLIVWIDKKLRAGEEWERTLKQQIEQSDQMVVLISPDIHRGDSWVAKEIALARASNKTILPFIVQSTNIPSSLENIHCDDISGEENDEKRILVILSQLIPKIEFPWF